MGFGLRGFRPFIVDVDRVPVILLQADDCRTLHFEPSPLTASDNSSPPPNPRLGT